MAVYSNPDITASRSLRDLLTSSRSGTDSFDDRTPKFWQNDSGFLLTQPFAVIVSDDAASRYHLRRLFDSENVPSAECTFQECFASSPPDCGDSKVYILDLTNCTIATDELVGKIKTHFIFFPPFILDQPPRTADRVAKFRPCAFGYYTKPCFAPDILHTLVLIFRIKQYVHAYEIMKQTSRFPIENVRVFGVSERMRQLIARIEEVAPAGAPVLVTGELGNRKDIVAQHLHFASRFKDGPFNSHSLIEAFCEGIVPYFFGAVPGAVDGFPHGRIGVLEMAHQGTYFIDYIESALPWFQERLLTCIKHNVIFREGSKRPIPVNIRFVIATYTDLEKKVEQGSFLPELYDLLSKTQILVPPMRECKQDVLLFFQYAIEWWTKYHNAPPLTIDPSAIDKLLSHSWPYNSREVEIVAKNAYYSDTDGVITAEDIYLSDVYANHLLNYYITNPSDIRKMPSQANARFGLGGMKMNDIEKQAIIETLEYCGGNKSQTAKTLGIAEKTLYNKLREYGLM